MRNFSMMYTEDHKICIFGIERVYLSTVTIATMIGLANIIGAASRVFGFEQPAGAAYLLLLAAIAGMIAIIAFFGDMKRTC